MKKEMIVLGLSTWDDASACIIRNGEVVAAAEEERFSRIKHHVGFPHQAVRFCLDSAGIALKDVDHVGHYWKPWVLGTRVLHVLKMAPNHYKRFLSKTKRGMGEIDEFWTHFRVGKTLRQQFGRSNFKLHFIDHHLSHAASAFFVSPFDEAAILTLDGSGESATTTMAAGRGNEISVLKHVRLPHSIGHLYSAITGFLGFRIMSDEGKVMGLSAFGDGRRYRSIFDRIIRPTPDGGFVTDFSYIDYHLARDGVFLQKTVDTFGKPRAKDEALTERHQDIAAALQEAIERIAIHLANHLYRFTKNKNLCLAGGVALNSVMNKKVLDATPFEHIYIQPAAGDAGCSLGSAFYVNHAIGNQERSFLLKHAYLGPSFSDDEIADVLKQTSLTYAYQDDICNKTAQLLSTGAIVGWFQGAMEFGPRALGNRSILADPRRAEMKDILNSKVKHRESFRPFAPAILAEKCGAYFEDDIMSPFMLLVHEVLPDKQDAIPAAIHVDGTARVQTVAPDENPVFYRLIEAFDELTGVPVLLNTSFNVMGEPIVRTPMDAIRCFEGTQIDHLVLGNYLVNKNGG